MIEIDGSEGEGGGQIVRSSLALAMVTGQAVRIRRVRAGRERVGLRRQHLAAVLAAAEVSGGRVTGAEVGSTEVTFVPGAVRAGTYRFAIGTAGSTTLVLQTVLPALVLADGPSRVSLEGGTHNEKAPPFEFLQATYLPLLARMGPRVEVTLERHGFYPAGGGRLTATIHPAPRLAPLHLGAEATTGEGSARILLSRLPRHVAEREARQVARRTGWSADRVAIEEVDAYGPGNAVLLFSPGEPVAEVFSAIGRRGVRAEDVAAAAVDEHERYLSLGAPVGEHLADQLVLPMALAGEGSFVTGPLSSHTTTHLDLVRRFLPLDVATTPLGDGRVRVALGRSVAPAGA